MDTVTVTSANSLVGQELMDRLAAAGKERVALVRKPATLLAGTDMVADWTTPGAAGAVRAAIGRADAVVHLSGELVAKTAEEYDAANVETTRIVADALRPGQRVVFLSYLGADPQSRNLFLRAKGRAEQTLQNSPAEAVIFRTQIIAHAPDAPGGFEDAIRQTKPGASVRLIGNGTGQVRPIAQGDVINAILAAVAGHCPAGTYELVGPEVMSLNDLVRLYNGDGRVPISHTPGWMARPLSRVIPDLTPTFVDLFLRPAGPGNPEPLASMLGLHLTPMSTLWAKTSAQPASRAIQKSS